MRLTRIPEFITEEERLELVSWMDKGIEDGILVKGLSRGQYGYKDRLTTRLNPDKITYPKVAFDIQRRILESFELTENCYIEPLGNGGMICVAIYPGGDTYKHKDPKLYGSAVRFNIILQKPEAGGELYVEGENFACEERELHCYNVTKNQHWVTEVEGDTPRYIWIFGMSIPHKDWEDGHVKRKIG